MGNAGGSDFPSVRRNRTDPEKWLFAGQNYGAMQVRRISVGMHSALFMVVAYSVAAFLIVYFGAEEMARLFMSADEAEVIRHTARYSVVTTAFFPILGSLCVFRYSTKGCGYAALAMGAGVFEMVARMLVGILAVPVWGMRQYAWETLWLGLQPISSWFRPTRMYIANCVRRNTGIGGCFRLRRRSAFRLSCSKPGIPVEDFVSAGGFLSCKVVFRFLSDELDTVHVTFFRCGRFIGIAQGYGIKQPVIRAEFEFIQKIGVGDVVHETDDTAQATAS